MPLLGDRDHHAHQCVGFEKGVSSPEDGYADMMNRSVSVLETQWPNCLQTMLTFFQFDNLGHTISPANKIYCINVGYTSSIKFIARMATVIESLTSIKNILQNFLPENVPAPIERPLIRSDISQ